MSPFESGRLFIGQAAPANQPLAFNLQHLAFPPPLHRGTSSHLRKGFRMEVKSKTLVPSSSGKPLQPSTCLRPIKIQANLGPLFIGELPLALQHHDRSRHERRSLVPSLSGEPLQPLTVHSRESGPYASVPSPSGRPLQLLSDWEPRATRLCFGPLFIGEAPSTLPARVGDGGPRAQGGNLSFANLIPA